MYMENMIVDNTLRFPLETNMNSYPNILTPPSSSEDSPQPVYFVASPNSISFQGPETYLSRDPTFSIPQSNAVINPHVLMDVQAGASLEFIEQPTDRFRFRYKSEMAGTHGSLTGVNSDKSRKQTYPTVEVRNCVGKVIVRCSIYQLATNPANQKDFMPHAHRLIMKKGKDELDDPHDIEIGPEEGYRAVFHGMGIIHTAKKNIVSELTRKKSQLKKEFIARTEGKIRELTTKELVEIKGLAESESKSINLNIVCLRFDAFIKQNGILFPLCEPIYSHGINNLKSALTGDLKISRLDHCVSEAKGGKEVYILVERVTKKNIKIRFYETDDEDRVVWEDYGKFNDLDVHHQYAIVFKTPKYRDQNINHTVKVFIELVRPSDMARSEPRDFRYIPNKDIYKAGRKRARYDYSSSTSYDSSNIGSDELPVVLNALQMDPSHNILSGLNTSNLSEELKKAMDDMNSDEFKKIYNANWEEITSIFELDAPKNVSRNIVIHHEMAEPQMNYSKICVDETEIRGHVECQMSDTSVRVVLKLEVTEDEERTAVRVIQELRSFIKSTHTKQEAIEVIKHYLGEDEKTNALHVAICRKDTDAAMFLLKIIAYYKQFHLIGNKNSDGLTPLHLGVLCHNEYLVKVCLLCRAKISATDGELNTPLHLAVTKDSSKEMFEMLLCNRDCEKISEYVDATNTNGDTALIMAIERRNMAAIKLLCMHGADVNKIHDKNGFVPLRFAIEKERTDVVKFLLSLPYVDASIKDFMNVSPLLAAISKSTSEDITNVIQKYMDDRGIKIEVKEEIEAESEEEEEEEEMEIELKDVKPQIPLDELEKLYAKVTNFTPKCLDEVSAMLDRSRNWGPLSDLLTVDHLISSGVIYSDGSMSKALLVYCVETNHNSLWTIRNFLENLDELGAVQAMDTMVRES
ncbi:unnamed protein product [Phaedon cochleariae]|uniref:RHD domain-containing protein n=1 Tax=Phaedon cochleariae TaxID=80249 RepID=A0A9P0DP13_PHACE|nr:unnamed protein product [Phaedon cochleariae]